MTTMRLSVNDLGFAYQRAGETRHIFRDATAHFAAGRFFTLMGPSGSGKTTLFRLLTRQLEPDSGEITIGERALADIPIPELRSSLVGQIFQDYLLIPFLTPLDNLLLSLEIGKGKATPADRERALELLDRVGLAGHSDAVVESLSGGEQQRVAIARALLGEAQILLADEPTGALDDANTAQIATLFADLAHEQGMIVIAGTHDQNFAAHADHIVRIRDYQLVME